MARHTLKILQHLLHIFQTVSEDFGTLCLKEIRQGLIQMQLLRGVFRTLSNFYGGTFRTNG